MKELIKLAATGWLVVIIFSFIGFAICSEQAQSYLPKDGFVPNEKTASLIAEAVLTAIYSEREIAREKPFTVTLQGDHWIVRGQRPEEYNRGGFALVEISKSNGCILIVRHGK